jgi:general secretion pathway protein J
MGGTAAASTNRGFTLVELLIAISLLGLMGVVTYSAVWTVSRSLNAVEERVEEENDLWVTQAFIRQSLSQARGVLAVQNERLRVLFSGEERALSFVAPAPLQLGNAGGLYRYRLDLADKEGGRHDLRLAYWQYLPGVTLDEEVEPQGEVILLEDVLSLDFSYFGQEQSWKKATWMERWPHRANMPKLVRIALTKGGDETVHTMTVAIRGAGG